MIEKPNDKTSSDKSSEAILDNIILQLHQESHHLRVWSFVMSIYGDAVMPHGGVISLKGLTIILTRMKIVSGALRTAMSRLARDGWMERFRARNTSFYQISQSMQQTIQQASLQIYAPPQRDYVWQGNWQLAIPHRQTLTPKILEDLQQMGFISLHALLYIRFVAPDELLPNKDDIIFMKAEADSSNPNILAMIQQNHKASGHYQNLSRQFQPLIDNLDKGGMLIGLDALVARILLIHYWRRAVLADESQNFANPFRHEAHLLTQKIYHHLWEESEAWLMQSDCIDKESQTKNISNKRFKEE